MRYIKSTIILFLVICSTVVKAQIPTDGLVASYPFNGNANDESGNGHQGSVNGAVLVEDRFGIPGSAYSFDGNDYITVPDHDDFSLNSKDFTISYWVYAYSNDTKMGLISKRRFGGGDASNWEYNFQTNPGTTLTHYLFNLQGNCGPYSGGYSDTVFNKNEWVNYIIVGNSTSLEQYKNGILYSEGVRNQNCSFENGSGPLVFGLGGGWNQTYYLNGSLDDINFYNRALTESEVSQLYGDFHRSNSEGLVLSLPFNGNANDESGNGYDALVYGPELTEDRFGNPNSAYYFDGVDDTIAIQKPLSDMLEMTISFWTKSEMEESNTVTIFCDGTVNTGGDDFLINVTSTKIGLRADKGGNNFNFENSSLSELSNLDLSTGWHHVVWNFDQISSEVYYDGDLLVTIPQVAANTINHDPTPILGAREVWSNKDSFFKGYLDDFLIYDVKLTPEEISSIDQEENTASNWLNWTIQEEPITYNYNSTDWYYIAYTKQKNGIGTIFINGDSVAQLNWRNEQYSHYKFNIASAFYTSYYDFFEGTIDEIKISNKVKTAQEIQTHYEADQSFQNDQNTFQIWKFDEGAGDVFSNINNNLTGNIYGDPEWVDGKFGKAIKYNGSDERSQVNLNLPENDVTYEFWVRFDGGIKKENQSIIQSYGMYNTSFNIVEYIPEEQPSNLQFSMNEESAGSNQEILYPVTVKGFTDILTAQYTISWDPTIVEYKGVQDFALRDLSENAFHLFEPGKLTFSWNPSDLQAESVDDDTEIFNIVFTTIGTAGEETLVSFTDVPTPREVSNGDGDVLTANYINGKITIIDELVLGGYLKTQKGEALAGIDVELKGENNQQTITDEFGWYSFNALPNQEYQIVPAFDTKADDGVTTLDIVIMHWHILGKKYMMSNLDLIACDVNKNKSLTTLDLAETRAVILHTKNRFRDRNAVEFVNYEYTGDDGIFEYKNYLDIIPSVSNLNLNFTAVKLGDGGRNWKVNKAKNTRENQLNEIEIILEKEHVSQNKVSIPLKAKDFKNMVGLQFTIEWDPNAYQFEELSKQQIEFISNIELVGDGFLTVTWNSDELHGLTLTDDDILSNLEFSVLDDTNDSNISISSAITPAYAFNSNLEAMNVKSKTIIGSELNKNDFDIYPNPANDILFVSGLNDEVFEYSIRSATGSTLISGRQLQGNKIEIRDLTSGVYILQLVDSGRNIIHKKFIRQ